jgi:hypothetical protein
MESWIQTLGDDGHVAVEVVVPPTMDMAVAAVDEMVPAAVREDQVLTPAVKREEEEAAKGLVCEGEEAVVVVWAEQVELRHDEDTQVELGHGEGAQVELGHGKDVQVDAQVDASVQQYGEWYFVFGKSSDGVFIILHRSTRKMKSNKLQPAPWTT